MTPISCGRRRPTRRPNSVLIDIHDVTTQWGVFALAGPNARAILPS